MLNAMPMPTAISEIPGGPLKADVSRAASRKGDAGSQDTDSFASTLESLHKKEAAAHKASQQDREEASPGTAEADGRTDNGEQTEKAAPSESPVDTVVTNPLTPVHPLEGKPDDVVTGKGLAESQPVLTVTDDKMTAGAAAPAMEGASKTQHKINAEGTVRPSVVAATEQTHAGAKADIGTETVAFKEMNRVMTSEETKQMAKNAGEANAHPLAGNKAPAETNSVPSDPEGQATPKPRPNVAQTASSENDGEGGGPVGKSEIEAGKRFANDFKDHIRALKHQEEGRQGTASENPSVRENNLDGQERTARSSASADTGAGVAKSSADNGQDAFAKMTAPEDSGPASGRPSAVDSGMPFTSAPAGGKAAPVLSSAMAQSTPAAAETFQSDNFNNLVEKALFTVRGGQSEARIALKPDQLGHVQMKIATENHIVTVKIVTESPVARDLIDANANQLRAELQQQGLNVESIEVSVSDDQRDAYRGARQRETFMRHMASNGKPSHEEEAPGHWEQRPGPRKANTFGAAGIDYFA